MNRNSDKKKGNINRREFIKLGAIAGVGTAIAMGGPGAIVWMWVTAILGMGLKYGECLLSLKYRVINKNGSVAAGPMYYLERGLKQKWLAILFALFAAIASLGIGNMVQANSVAEPIAKYFPTLIVHPAYCDPRVDIFGWSVPTITASAPSSDIFLKYSGILSNSSLCGIILAVI